MRYEIRPIGVFDRELGRVIGRGDRAWLAYQAWVAAGNVPAPEAQPVRALEQRRADVLAAVNARRAAALTGGLVFAGERYDTDEASRANVTAVVAAVSAGIPLPEGFAWRTADNRNVAMDAGELLALGAAMLDHGERCYRRSWELKALVQAADEPEAVDVAGGWPG